VLVQPSAGFVHGFAVLDAVDRRAFGHGVVPLEVYGRDRSSRN
jgi:hypothetical protein